MPTAKDVIRSTIETADFLVNTYLADLSDDDMYVSLGGDSNSIAWQLGHLIVSERQSVETLKPGSCPALPERFAESHTKETGWPNAFEKVGLKDDYLKAAAAQRAATLAVLDGLTDEELDAPTGVDYAPTTYLLFNMVGIHILMHIGQFVALRRKLGKPVVM